MGRILFLGLQAVGKTSIINRIKEQSFRTKIKPTLGVQILNLVINNTKFMVFDMGGQEKIRSLWYDDDLKPDAIVYVIDLSLSSEQHKKAREEFNKVLDFFIINKKDSDSGNIPVLILGNKCDLIDETKVMLNNIIYTINPSIHFKMANCSAKENIGITNNFKWLIGEIVKCSNT